MVYHAAPRGGDAARLGVVSWKGGVFGCFLAALAAAPAWLAAMEIKSSLFTSRILVISSSSGCEHKLPRIFSRLPSSTVLERDSVTDKNTDASRCSQLVISI